MKHRVCLLIAALTYCGCMMRASDTLFVFNAMRANTMQVNRPYVATRDGKTFEPQKPAQIISDNAALAYADTPLPVSLDERLDTTGDALHTLRFTIRARSFAVAELKIFAPKNHQIYLDKQPTGTQLKLKPGEVEVTLVAYTAANEPDSFRVALIGDNLGDISINDTSKRPFSQQDILLGDHYASPRMSASGKYISYSIRNQRANGKSTYQTFIRETKTQRLVQKRLGFVRHHWLSAEDRLLVEETNADDTRNLLIVDPATGAAEPLATNLPANDYNLSPQLDYLVYSKEVETKESTAKARRLTHPDDRIPGHGKERQLYLFNIKTRQTSLITAPHPSLWLNDISPDGRCLLISYSDMRPERTPFSKTTFVILNLDTHSADTLLVDEGFLAEGTFSPDGKQVLLRAGTEAFNRLGSEVGEGQIANSFDYRLFLLDLNSKRVEFLLPGFKPNVKRAEWNNGDGNIYFSAENGHDVCLYLLSPRTKKVVEINLPITYVQEFSLSNTAAKPQLIVHGQSGNTSRKLYVGEIGKAMRQIGEIDFEADMQNVSLPRCENWAVETSRGDTLQNFFFYPSDLDPAKRYPMIVYYYGGCSPTGKLLEGAWPLSTFAQMGYIVLVVEPSGATGFGQEFAARHVNTWGEGTAQDIIESVQRFCQTHPYVNANKIGCMGASYGGFMTEYLQTQTDLFACAISHAGISDITGYWGGGYWGYTYGETAEYGSFPWSNTDLFVKHSPLYNADKIHTPLLLLHGTDDTNVPTVQSQALYTALRILNREVEYITIGNENHVVSEYGARQEWQEIINAWFAKWLQDKPLWWNTLYPAENKPAE